MGSTWNELALSAAGLDHIPVGAGESRRYGEQLGSTRTAGGMAMVHIVMYDALNSIESHHKTYLAMPTAPVGASIKAAIFQAAHDVLLSLCHSQQETFLQN